MKTLCQWFRSVVAVLVIPASAWADGTVQFFNTSLSKVQYQQAPGSVVFAPIGTRIGIFWGTDPTNLSLALPTTTISTTAGIFSGSGNYPIPGTQPGQTIYLKFAGWNGNVGDHWSNSTMYGESAVVLTSPLGFPEGPGTVVWQSASGVSPNRVKPFTIGGNEDPQRLFQTIDFPAIAPRTFGDGPVQLQAVASSGLPITYTISLPSVGRIEGSTLTILGAGQAVITAHQAGSILYWPVSVTRQLTVARAKAVVSVVERLHRFDGREWRPSVVTVPPGLPVVLESWRPSPFGGLGIPLVSVGPYLFNAYVTSPNYEGVTNGTLDILPGLLARTSGGGAVSVDPPSGPYFEDGTARAIATAASGWTFLQWLGAGTGAAPALTLTMDRTRCLEAVFGTGLNGDAEGGGNVVRSPAGALYPHGQVVELTAVPEPGNYFDHWKGDATGSDNPLRFKVESAAPRVTAVFAPLPAGSHAITVLAEGFGRVERGLPGHHLPEGVNLVLLAVPEDGQDFIGWSGDASGTENPLVVSITDSRTITARFSRRPRLSVFECEGVTVDAFQLLVTGEYGARYGIESKPISGGAGWERRGAVATPYGISEFLEPLRPGPVPQVYRAVQE